MQLNPSSAHVDSILNGVEKCNGNCPCIPKYLHTEDTLCPCHAFRTDSICKCDLYIPITSDMAQSITVSVDDEMREYHIGQKVIGSKESVFEGMVGHIIGFSSSAEEPTLIIVNYYPSPRQRQMMSYIDAGYESGFMYTAETPPHGIEIL